MKRTDGEHGTIARNVVFHMRMSGDRDEKDVALQTRTRQIIQCRSTEPECYCTLELLRASYTQVQGILDTRLVRIDKSSRFGSVYRQGRISMSSVPMPCDLPRFLNLLAFRSSKEFRVQPLQGKTLPFFFFSCAPNFFRVSARLRLIPGRELDLLSVPMWHREEEDARNQTPMTIGLLRMSQLP